MHYYSIAGATRGGTRVWEAEMVATDKLAKAQLATKAAIHDAEGICFMFHSKPRAHNTLQEVCQGPTWGLFYICQPVLYAFCCAFVALRIGH